MQASHITEGIQDLTKRIFSSDPVEYNSAVNAYCEPQATYLSPLIVAHGASRIKKALFLDRYLVRRRERVRPSDDVENRGGEKRKEWDEVTQVLTIKTRTTYGLPFALPLIDFTLTFPSTMILTLNVNEDGELDEDDLDVAIYSDDSLEGDSISTIPGAGNGKPVHRLTRGNEEGEVEDTVEREQGPPKRYWITKWEEKNVLDAAIDRIGIIRKIHHGLVIPLLTPLLLILASTLQFWNHHPLRDGIIKFVVAAMLETWEGLTMEVGRRLSGTQVINGRMSRNGNERLEKIKSTVKDQTSEVVQKASHSFHLEKEQKSSSSSIKKSSSKSSKSTSPPSSIRSPLTSNPAQHLTPGKAKASTSSGFHSGLHSNAALVDGITYAEVVVPSTTAADSMGEIVEGREHHLPVEPNALSYAEVVAE